MNAHTAIPDRCVVCGQRGSLDAHHLAGVRHLPDAVLPVCASRHIAWHRRLRAAGIDLAAKLRGSRELLRAVALGFGVVCEDAALLAADPAGTRAMVRADVEELLLLTDADTPVRSPVMPTVRHLAGTSPGDGQRDCQARRPRNQREARRRSLAFATGILGALAAVFDAVIAPSDADLNLPARLREMQRECQARDGGVRGE
jgi:hypothetical protein